MKAMKATIKNPESDYMLSISTEYIYQQTVRTTIARIPSDGISVDELILAHKLGYVESWFAVRDGYEVTMVTKEIKWEV